LPLRPSDGGPPVSPGAEMLAALDVAAADLGDVGAEMDGDGGRTWSRDGVAFAHLVDNGAAELRIGVVIADAALRTPDTLPSGRGADWVMFAPPILDDHARDRLVAWFAAAHRRAARAS
jgi:hypothetical protein